MPNKKPSLNASQMPTHKLREILNDPYTRGIDGADYGPLRDELEQELYRRGNKELETQMHLYNQQQKELYRIEHNKPKRKSTYKKRTTTATQET